MAKLTPEEEANKRFIYEKMSPRRRKFIDRVGYDNWDPFITPKDPIDIRKDPTNRTTQELVRMFLRSRGPEKASTAYNGGVLELALGIMNGQDRFLGMFEFSVWYNDLLKREGIEDEPGTKTDS